MAVSGSLAQAEDALQDALLAALPGVIEKIDHADAWLYVAALRALKRARWRHRLERSLAHLRVTQPPPNDDRPDIVRLIASLPPRQRQVIVGRYYLDLTYAEIAAGLGISVGTATSTATQALQRMRKELLGKGLPRWTGTK